MKRSSINRPLVERKLERLQGYLEELGPVTRLDFDAYRRDVTVRRQAERSLELLIMTACDINSHIFTRLTEKPPSDYHDSFLRLGEFGGLP